MSFPAGNHVLRRISQERDAEKMGRTQRESDFYWKKGCYSQLKCKMNTAGEKKATVAKVAVFRKRGIKNDSPQHLGNLNAIISSVNNYIIIIIIK